jgi:hypothetical protein
MQKLTDITKPELDTKLAANIDVYREQFKK